MEPGKKCSKCGKVKSLEEFHNQTKSKDGKTGRCKKCNAEYNKEWQRANPDRARERWRLAEKKSRNLHRRRARRFKLTDDELSTWLLIKQCQICGTAFDDVMDHLDHDHKTGKVRGILCRHCNTGLGLFRDNPQLLTKAIEYLNASQALK